ncbi:hypothetical protein FRC09_017571 [Ceratobasidium sp. 395]|nr:hypothetical protein FRC09_017571 [Ceratobasidium sp. 395]
MRMADATGIFLVLDCLPFPHLSSLRLGIEQQPEPDPLDNVPWEYQIVKLIVKGCPRLKELRIDFDETGSYPQPCNLLAPVKDGDAIKLMSTLPLETLYLSSAALGNISGVPNGDLPYKAGYLMAAWPQLTKLHMPHFIGDFKRLYEFSQLPNLQELTLGLNLTDNWRPYYDTANLNNLSAGSSPLRVLGASYKTDASGTLSRFTASALLRFWPNLEQIDLRLDPDDMDDDYSQILARI